MMFRKKERMPWSGEQSQGPSFSGMCAVEDGLLPQNELIKALNKFPEIRSLEISNAFRTYKKPGSVLTNAVFKKFCVRWDAEKHHLKNSRGVELVVFGKPEEYKKQILEDLGE